MKNILITILLLFNFSTFSQNISKVELDKEIKPLFDKIRSLNSDNAKLKRDFELLNSKLDSLNKQTKINIDATNQELVSKISTTEMNTNQKIHKVDESLSTNSLYGIIGVLVAVLVSILLYFLLNKKQQSDKSDVEGQISKTKQSIEEEQIQLNTKLAELYNGQMELIKAERKAIPNSQTIDHSLPLKVADEITRINAYANTLDPNSQDAKGLKSSVKRLINTFKVAQYEIIDLLGQKYDDRIPMLVLDRIENNNLNSGEEIISRIIKPLVKHKGEQIQAAQVETSFN